MSDPGIAVTTLLQRLDGLRTRYREKQKYMESAREEIARADKEAAELSRQMSDIEAAVRALGGTVPNFAAGNYVVDTSRVQGWSDFDKLVEEVDAERRLFRAQAEMDRMDRMGQIVTMDEIKGAPSPVKFGRSLDALLDPEGGK